MKVPQETGEHAGVCHLPPLHNCTLNVGCCRSGSGQVLETNKWGKQTALSEFIPLIQSVEPREDSDASLLAKMFVQILLLHALSFGMLVKVNKK